LTPDEAWTARVCCKSAVLLAMSAPGRPCLVQFHATTDGSTGPFPKRGGPLIRASKGLPDVDELELVELCRSRRAVDAEQAVAVRAELQTAHEAAAATATCPAPLDRRPRWDGGVCFFVDADRTAWWLTLTWTLTPPR